jgi:peptide deformylase
MAVRKILTLGRYEKMLRSRSEPVKKINRDVRQLVEDIKETIDANPAAGLAAVQIGVLQRVFGARLGQRDEETDDETLPTTIFINPEIVEISEEVERGFDGCLSIPGMWGYTDRALRIKVRYQDERGTPTEGTFEGYDARVILHEYDHLEGVLFLDRLNTLDDLFVVAKDSDGKTINIPYPEAIRNAERSAAQPASKAAGPDAPRA